MTVRLLHLLFFFTGTTGLVYQVIWTRMLGQVVGNTTEAVGLVLAAFMAGLALGSWRGGLWADRRTDPLRAYALLEVGVAVCALAIPYAFEQLVSMYVGLHGGGSTAAPWLGGVRFLLAFIVLVIPTFLMGATLPVLTRFAVRSRDGLGSRLGTLYGINTLGAMVGAALSGFVLMRLLGISGANYVAVAANMLVAVAAFVLHLRTEPVPLTLTPSAYDKPEPLVSGGADEAVEVHPAGSRFVWFFGLSGMVALSLEVLWTKSLSFFLGNSIHAFATMLSTFLLGISLGAFFIARRVDNLRHPKRAMGLCLIGMGATGMATLPAFGAVMNAMGHLPGYVTGFLVAGLVMLPATLFMGAMLPLTARIYVGQAEKLAGRVGRMYAINTVGAILGSLFAAFVFIPLLGIQGSILLSCALVLVAGIGIMISRRGQGRMLVTALTAAGGVAVLVFFVATTRERFFSVLDYSFRAGFEDEVESLYYKETSSGIVEVTREAAGFHSYKIDSQNQAKTSIMGLRVHNLLSQLGLLLHPHPKDVLMVALGGGMTAGGSVPLNAIYQYDSVDVVEISPAIVEVAAHFSQYNNDVLSFPRLNVFIEDGRNFMLTGKKKYDVIVTGVIHPKYNPGNAGMYGREYYGLVRERLKPGGVVVQWAPVNALRVSEYKRMVATFIDAFPHATLWFSQNFGGYARGNNNLIMIGSLEPLPLNYTTLARKVNHPVVAAALSRFGVDGPLEILRTFVTDQDGMKAYTEGFGVVYDDHNPFEFLTQEEHAPAVLESILPYREPLEKRLVGANARVRARLDADYRIATELLQADLAADRRQFDEAMRRYDEVVAAHPDHEIVEARKQILDLARWYAAKERDLARANPESADRCRSYVQALFGAQMWNAVAAEVTRCLGLIPHDPDLLLTLGLSHFRAQQLPEARQAWEKMVQVAPGRHEGHYNLGLLAEQQKRPAEAAYRFATAAKVAPDNIDALYAAGESLRRLGRWNQAARVASRILVLDPEHKWAVRVTEMIEKRGPAPTGK